MDSNSSEVKRKTLLVPAVAIGNVGQLALDYIHTKLGSVSIEHLDNLALLPYCVGRSSNNGLTTSLELITINESLGLLQVRAPIVPGKSRLFAKHVLLYLAKQHGYVHIIVVGGASALALTNETDFYETRQIPRVYQTKSQQLPVGFLPLFRDNIFQLRLAGLAPYFVQEASSVDLELTVIVLYVFEGENEQDGELLGQQAMRYFLQA